MRQSDVGLPRELLRAWYAANKEFADQEITRVYIGRHGSALLRNERLEADGDRDHYE